MALEGTPIHPRPTRGPERGRLAGWRTWKYFNYCQGSDHDQPGFRRTLLRPGLRGGERIITQREMDLAASIQAVTEEAVFRMARTAQRLTGSKYLCLAGGVALNCVANGKLLRKQIFDDIFITPAAGDAGGLRGTVRPLSVAGEQTGRERR
jgi:carbamoyltransferase